MTYTLSTYQIPPCLNCWLSSSQNWQREVHLKLKMVNNLLKVRRSYHITSNNSKSLATQDNVQVISKLEGEGFRRSIRPHAQCQTWSPPKNHKACHASTWNCRAKWTGSSSFWKYESLPFMCLKYNIGSLKTRSKDVIYHMLDKTLKFSTTKM